MDLKRTGALIAQRRRELELTQSQLAELVGVTDKAISRWETGRGFPDAAYLQPLAQALDLSITEIVNGEMTQPETAARQADAAALSMLRYGRKMLWTVAMVLLIIAGAVLSLAPLYALGKGADCLFVLGAYLLMLAMVLPCFQKGVSSKLMQGLALAFLPVCLILQMLPVSAAMVFAGPTYHNRVLYSCFDPMLWGYANIWPTLSGLLTASLVLMSVILLIGKQDKLRDAIFVCSILAGLFMLLPLLLFGWEYLTAVGLLVVLLLFSSAMLQANVNGRKLPK